VLIENDRLASVTAEALKETPNMAVVDARGKLIIPGLINTHVHAPQQLARGLADDVDLATWITHRVKPFEEEMGEEDIYTSTLLCGIELIRSGTTTFAEAEGHHMDLFCRAVHELGLRGVLVRCTNDLGTERPVIEPTDEAISKQEDVLGRWNNTAEGRIKIWFGVTNILNNSDDLVTRTKELADRHGVGIHMHVAEAKDEIEFALNVRGHTTVEHLEHLGVLDKNLLAIHCAFVTDHEIDLFAQRDVKVSHNPAAGMRYMGFPRIPEMIAKGITVSIGTDGAPSNNRMSIVDEMYLTALIHKARTLDCTVMPARVILDMATRNGARSLLWEDEIGSLEVGKKADLVIINPRTANMLPMHDPISNLVNSMKTENIESTMVNGRWLMREKKILTIAEEDVYREAEERAVAIRERVGIKLPRQVWGESSKS
jgi:5-methylthioadenosine/S-adenosylhomocysteine deaminase